MKKKDKSIIDEHHDQFIKKMSSPAQSIIDSVVESAQSFAGAAVFGENNDEPPAVKSNNESLLSEIKRNIDRYDNPSDKLKYLNKYLQIKDDHLHIIGTLCEYMGMIRAKDMKVKPVNGNYLSGIHDNVKNESQKILDEISKTNVLNYYRLNRDYILSLGTLPPEIRLLDDIFKIIFLEIEMISSNDILSCIIDDYVRRLQWKPDKQILHNQLLRFRERGRIDFTDDYIIIIGAEPYRFIIGLIEFWENEKYIPELKHGKTDRIKNNFRWQTPKLKIESFEPDTLYSRRAKGRAEGLREIENLLK